MEEVNRIKEIMNIREDKMPRTAPINTQGLVRIIQMTVNNLDGEIDFDNLNPDSEILGAIANNLKFIGEKDSWETMDYLYAFCKENFVLLSNQKYDYTEYIIPQKKKFRWRADEDFNATIRDTYVGTEEGYSVEFLRDSFNSFEFDPTTGQRIEHEYLDTWDTEWTLNDIEETPMNEEISKNLRDLQDLFG